MADHWTHILEYLTYAEADASKAVSTDVRLAARTVLEVGRFEKVTTALWLIPRLHSHPKFRFAEEDACVRAAWGIEPGLVAVKAVTCGQRWVLADLEPTSDGLPRIVAALEGVCDGAFPQAFASWSETILDEERLLRSDEEFVRARRAAADDSLSEDERGAWAEIAGHIYESWREVFIEMEDEVYQGLYRELGRWADVKRVVILYYMLHEERLTADHAAYLSSDWPDEKKRAAFADAVLEDNERFVHVRCRTWFGEKSRATAPRYATRSRTSTFAPRAGETDASEIKPSPSSSSGAYQRRPTSAAPARAERAHDARYSERTGVDVASLRFLFDGRCISSDDTPRELNIQDDDMILLLRPRQF